MADGDTAEGAEQGGDLHIEDIGEAALKLATLQKHLPTVLQALGAVHDYVNLGVGAGTPDIACRHLDVVHNACGVQLQSVLSDSLCCSLGALI